MQVGYLPALPTSVTSCFVALNPKPLNITLGWRGAGRDPVRLLRQLLVPAAPVSGGRSAEPRQRAPGDDGPDAGRARPGHTHRWCAQHKRSLNTSMLVGQSRRVFNPGVLPKPPCTNDLHVLDCTIGMAAQDTFLRWAGEPAPEKRKVWVIARQHPGETMAEFFAEVGSAIHADCQSCACMCVSCGTSLAWLLSCICCPGSLKLACAIVHVACSAKIVLHACGRVDLFHVLAVLGKKHSLAAAGSGAEAAGPR